MSPMSPRRDRGPVGLLSRREQTRADASLAGRGRPREASSSEGVCSRIGSLKGGPHPGALPANGEREKTRGRTSGFSLAEVLVALAVAAMMAAVLTRYVGGTRANAAQVRERLELWTLSQSMLDGLSNTLSPGTSSGRSGAYRWHREVAPIAFDAVVRMEAPSAPGALDNNLRSLRGRRTAAPSTAWVVYRVSVRIEAPSGRQYAADTIRIAQPSPNTR
jgi:prepilin-type N-terminal cleavage/methylation domain-containing protein